MRISIFRRCMATSVALVAACWLALAAAPAAAQTATAPQQLSNDAAVGSIAGAQGSARYYAFTVPAGATRATFAITGSSGDCDIYVRYGSVPTTSTFDHRPYLSSSNETVNVSAPRAGTWYVMLRGYTAYSGVTLRAAHDAGGSGGTTPAAAAPTLSPAPGTYSGQVSVRLATTTPGAVIRFTLDGSTPTASSEVYAAPIVVSATTTIRAIGTATGYSTSTVAGGTYTITNAVRTLALNTPLADLAGSQGSTSHFRLAVPAGVASVTVSTSGGTGDADLYVRYGQLPTTSAYDRVGYTSGNNESITINTPRAGDYYVMIYGYRAYSGLTLRGTVSGSPVVGKPDLTVWAGAMSPRVTTETFSAGACEIEEGTAVVGTRRLLRFTTQSRNIGTADLTLGNPANNALFEWGSCHGHYHFRSFAQYRLLDTAGAVVRTGRKVGFCLMDITRIDSGANPSPRYTCSNQGIQAGWADVYSSSLSGQWIDITGLPAGQYQLEVAMDPMNVVDELNETNNVSRVPVTVP